jgi:hypothetical protein
MAILFGNIQHCFESHCQHIISSFLICFILTNTQFNYAVAHPLFNYMFQNYLCCIGKVRNASDVDFLFLFCFVYRHSDLEGSCSMGLKLGMLISLLLVGRSGSRDLALGCTIWNTYGKELVIVWWVCWGSLNRGWFHSRLVSGVGWGSEVLLEQVQLNFSFRNKFIILLPCGLLVDNNTYSKMCVFKSLSD